MSSDDRAEERARARARRAALEAEWRPPTSLYGECLKFAESTDDGCELLLKALLFSEQWSRPPTADIAAHDAAQAWDYAMHHKTLAEYAIAHAHKLTGDTGRAAFHLKRAEIAFPRVFWHSEIFLEHAANEIRREKAKLRHGESRIPAK